MSTYRKSRRLCQFGNSSPTKKSRKSKHSRQKSKSKSKKMKSLFARRSPSTNKKPSKNPYFSKENEVPYRLLKNNSSASKITSIRISRPSRGSSRRKNMDDLYQKSPI